MSREDLHFRLRIPEALKQRIEASSRENHRSMTAEIIARLEESVLQKPRPEETARLEAENATLRYNFEVIAAQLAGPIGENSEKVLAIMTALRILGKVVPE